MNEWRKLRALRREDRRVLVEAAIALLVARLALPFVTFRAHSPRAEARHRFAPDTAARAGAIARLVGIAAARSPVRLTCLSRSLALWWLLRRRGIPCAIRVGVHRPGNAFAAHAWVECAGVPLDERFAHAPPYRTFEQAIAPHGDRPAWRGPTRRAG